MSRWSLFPPRGDSQAIKLHDPGRIQPDVVGVRTNSFPEVISRKDASRPLDGRGSDADVENSIWTPEIHGDKFLNMLVGNPEVTQPFCIGEIQ
jgi:hypothetical protein